MEKVTAIENPKKRIQIFQSFEEQELAALTENLKKSMAERLSDAIELIRKVYPKPTETRSKTIVFGR